MKTVADLRVAACSQDLATVRLVVLDHARQERFAIDSFVEAHANPRAEDFVNGCDLTHRYRLGRNG
jgi:hypothetical protein